MKRYGLIGYPLGHSFSQKYFTEKFSRENIDADYTLFPIPTIDDLPALLNDIPELVGLNVTIPYKEKVIPFLDDFDADAKAVGAYNVIKITRQPNGKYFLKGYNSDTYGFRESIRPLLQPHHKKALVLGTGGASKAAVATLHSLGISTTLVSRSQSKGQLTYDDLSAEVMAENLLIVNATPLGMSPNVDTCPPIPYDCLTTKHLCFDIVYNPLKTLFLQKAEQQGVTIKNGLEMLHLQAEGAWKIWNEK